MNVRRLRAIARLMQKYPDHVNMQYWFSRKFTDSNGSYPVDPVRLMSEKSCNTMGCIGGWALRYAPKTETIAHVVDYSEVKARAAELLDISDEQASRLMIPREQVDFPDAEPCWPESFANRYNKAKTAVARAKVVADRIEHFIKTHGEE